MIQNALLSIAKVCTQLDINILLHTNFSCMKTECIGQNGEEIAIVYQLQEHLVKTHVGLLETKRVWIEHMKREISP